MSHETDDFLVPEQVQEAISRYIQRHGGHLKNFPLWREETDAERMGRKVRAEKRAVDRERFRSDLSTIVDPLARSMLDLHAEVGRVGDWPGDCDGCDFGGWEGEQPRWPCRTVEAIAEHFDITLPA